MSDDVLRALVPLDGSEEAESILAALVPLAQAHRVHLMLFRVVDPDEPVASAERYLGTLGASLERQGFESSTKCEWGKPAEEIVWLGKEVRYDLIAMSTHGRTGLRRTFLGSVTEEVLRHAEVPLLVNRPGTRTGDWKRIVVGLDGSPLAERVLPDAARLARTFRASLHVVKAVMPALMMGFGDGSVYEPAEDPLPYLRGVCQGLEREGVTAVPEPREGPPAAEICDFAQEIGAGLICIATHGRTGLGRLILGSTAETVLRRAPCPVFVRRAVLEPDDPRGVPERDLDLAAGFPFARGVRGWQPTRSIPFEENRMAREPGGFRDARPGPEK